MRKLLNFELNTASKDEYPHSNTITSCKPLVPIDKPMHLIQTNSNILNFEGANMAAFLLNLQKSVYGFTKMRKIPR